MSPINVHDILERAKNASRVGDNETTERLLKSYIAKVPGNREACLLLGNTYANEGRLSEAADQFTALLARNPNDIEALNNAAVICRRQGKFQEALDFLHEAIDIDPTKVEFHYNSGNIHKELGNYKAASMSYSRVIELDPNYVQAYNNLGTIYDRLKEYDKAFAVFRKGLALDQNNPTLRFNYGVSLQANGNLEDAANEYRSALRTKPGWLEPINNLGIVHFMQGHHDKALATFARVLKMDPSNAEAYNNTGVVLADQGRIQDAIKNYRLALAADPQYSRAVINLEQALEDSGDFADAVIELEKLLQDSPGNVDIRTRLAGIYLKLERYPEALEQAESVLKRDADNIQALRIKGAIQRIMGNDRGAQVCFEKILAKEPGNYDFLLDLADIHFRRKEYKEAEGRIQSYLIKRPNDRDAKLFLGKLYGEMGNRAHAIQIFEELAKADPDDTEALAAVAELHKKAGSLEKALRTADTLVNLQGKRATADDLTDLNKSLEFYESAVNAYSSSVRDIWDRNLKLMGREDKEIPPEDDTSLLMGASEISDELDEEIEALFVEGPETFTDLEEETEDIILGDEPFGELVEELESSQADDFPDNLVEEPEIPPPKNPQKTKDSPPPEDDSPPLPARPAEDAQFPQESPPPQMPSFPKAPPPQMPPFPEYPPYRPDIPKPPETPLPQETLPEISLPMDEPPEEALPELSLIGEEAPEEEIPEEVLPEMDTAGEESPEEEIPEEDPSEMDAAGEDFPEEDTPDEDEIPPLENEISPFDAEEEEDSLEDETPPPESEPIDLSADEDEIPLLEETPEDFLGEPAPADDIPEAGELYAESAEEEFPVESAASNTEIGSIIQLLKHLRGLTEELPEKDRITFSQGELPTALESVIDSLRNLVIIKGSTVDTGVQSQEDSGESNGVVDGSGR